MLAGCGGGSDETGTSSADSESLSKAQYVTRADAICSEANTRQDALLTKEAQSRSATGVPSDADKESFVLNSGLPPLREAAARLDKLGTPTGDEKKAEALVDALDKALDEIEEEPLDFAEAKSNPFAPVERLARELGLEVCGLP